MVIYGRSSVSRRSCADHHSVVRRFGNDSSRINRALAVVSVPIETLGVSLVNANRPGLTRKQNRFPLDLCADLSLRLNKAGVEFRFVTRLARAILPNLPTQYRLGNNKVHSKPP
jgi:hypothetical protein